MPPFVKWMFENLINPLMKVILRSPFHGLVSEHLMLLTFTGQKSKRQYTTPVGYNRDGSTLYILTESPWWKNFHTEAPVTLHLTGTIVKGNAIAITDPETTARVILPEIQQKGAAYAKRRYRLNLDPNKTPELEDLLPAVQNTTLIKIEARQFS